MTTKYPSFDLKNICRLCLSQDGTMSIFNERKSEKSSLLQRILCCLPLDVTEGDGLPASVCENCVCILDKFYDFRELCKQSALTLKRKCVKSVQLCGSKVDSKSMEIGREVSMHEDKICTFINNERNVFCEDLVADVTSVTQGSDTEISKSCSENVGNKEERNKIVSEYVTENQDTGSLNCQACVKSFAKQVYLKKHEIMHTRRKSWSCKNCGSGFAHSIEFPWSRRYYCICKGIEAGCSVELNKNSNFVCSLCSKTFTKRVYLKRHEVVHSGERPYICTECGNSFSRTGDLAKHLRIHARSKVLKEMSPITHSEPRENINGKVTGPLSCKVCSRTFTREYYLKQHEIVHNETSTYLCEQCGKSFYRRGALMQHMATHSKIKSHLCNLCNKTFAYLSRLKEHKRLHAGTKSYLCNICGKAFATKEGLMGHERTHTGEKPYICALCDRSFATSSNFRTHMRHHTEGKRFPCKTCEMSFFTKSGLERHEGLHTGVKPFQCDICTLAFYTKREVIRHKLFHLGNKRFSCDKCNKSYYERQHLVVHERTHTGERPYSCSWCMKSFFERSKLNRHMHIHKI
ncbi:zinc finger protein 345-like [Periplaneta americana]|uniref:zinc finger protein 345-like n=1 Tax=Periplaneta americana TaxID=6978 RepID=UPI0037E72E6D